MIGIEVGLFTRDCLTDDEIDWVALAGSFISSASTGLTFWLFFFDFSTDRVVTVGWIGVEMVEACIWSLLRGVIVGGNVEVASVIEVLEAVGAGEFCGTGVVGVDGRNEVAL